VKNQPAALVWSLCSVNNGEEIVAGDSMGNVTFWNVETCTWIRKLSEHQADVLCLASTSDMVLSAGVDAKIAMYTTSDDNWMFHRAVFSHSHDIRAFAVDSKGRIASGGVDATLTIQTMDSKPNLLSPFSHPMQVSLSSSIALVQHCSHAEVWFFRSDNDNDDDVLPRRKCARIERIHVPDRTAKQQKLIDVSLLSSGHLVSSALAPDGCSFALSNNSGTRLFSFQIEELACRKMDVAYDDPSSCLVFTGSQTLAAASLKTFEVVVLDTANGVQARFDEHRESISLLVSSREWLVSCDVGGQMFLYNMDALEMDCKVPCFDKGRPTSIAFTKAKKQQLVAVSSYHQISVFDVDSRSIQTLVSIPWFVLRPHHRICGIITHPHEPEKILLWSPIGLIKANLAVETSSEKENSEGNEIVGKRRIRKTHFSSQIQAWQTEKRFRWIQSLLEIPWTSQSYLMFEVTPSKLQALLPKQFARKTYGT